MAIPTTHASCVAFGTLGVLVRGPSAAGKSSFCDRLVETARSRGTFAAWVGDDRVHLEGDGHHVVAHPAGALAGKLEVRGLGILETGFLPSAAVDLVVDLMPLSEIDRLPEASTDRILLEGLLLPRCRLAENRSDEGLRRLRWVLRELFPNRPDYF